MGNRWHMSRMGFVNFWLYDEEIFSFQDGKLLLRGQNGSGKSITTQSFIPFILDGDRTPSRLDPFGSSDRRMEYYFLGEGEREESTGYLFLEFKRENIDQYRTIGIGQRAQRGKPMSFWGFILLDGRRIGYDLELYRQVGTKKLPCTKQELKQIVGEENFFTETQSEYMEQVNRYLFGFATTEQYRQFIRLLVKVRAPKLSKEFKPTKVYDILNDSLQTLSDEDLRAMVDAMEKMDEIQDQLEHVKAAFKDLNIIRNEYLRYNLYMLGKKAQAYVAEKDSVDRSRHLLKEREASFERKKRRIVSLRQEMVTLEDEIRVLEAEKDSMHLEDLEHSMDRLEKAKEDQKKEEKDKLRLETKIEDQKEKIRLSVEKMRTNQIDLDHYQRRIADFLEQLDGENETLQAEFHQSVRNVIARGDSRTALSGFHQQLQELTARIRQGQDALRQLAEAQQLLDEEEKRLHALQVEKQQAQEQYRSAEKMEEQCRDEFIEALYVKAAENQEMRMTREELEEATGIIRAYENAGDTGSILSFYQKAWSARNRELDQAYHTCRNERGNCYTSVRQLRKELTELEEMRILTPSRRNAAEEARRMLRKNGISFVPFYEAVEFVEGTSQEEMNRLERQLDATGLLDALIVSDRQRQQAMTILQDLSDRLLTPGEAQSGACPLLVPADVDPSLQKAITDILGCISEDQNSEAELVLARDGYFRNGALEGYCQPEEEASYVGAMARQRNKERLLREKREELQREEDHLKSMDAELTQMKERMECLRQEKELLPSCDDLNQAIEWKRASGQSLDQVARQTEEQETRTLQSRNTYRDREQQVIRECRLLPYPRKQEEYEAALEAANGYQFLLQELERTLGALNEVRMERSHIEETIEREEETIEEHYDFLRRTERVLKELSVQIDRINQYLNDPQVKQMAHRMEEIKKQLKEKQARHHDVDKEHAVHEAEVERLAGEIEETKQYAARQIAKETLLRTYFEEELSLGLIMKPQGDRSVYDIALEAREQIRDGDQNRSGTEMTTALMKTFHSHLGSLVSYGTTMEECFGGSQEDSSLLRTRQQIAAIWGGRKLYLEEFYIAVREYIESTELLIRDKEREIFEETLSDTLSRKLSSRIRMSREWIKDMSALMRGMDTSMDLTFSLEWRPKKAEEANELDIKDLELILARDRVLLTAEDIDKVASHFRAKIYLGKQAAEENGEPISYMELVRDALDYRRWFEFRMNYHRGADAKKELTNSAFNRFSGGEKAMAMYVPLFAAVSAQYKKAELSDHPRIIALDEAFAGVDDRNISSMFQLVQHLDFDYIMNSQVLWGCYKTVHRLQIAELLKPDGVDVVTVIHYIWNGRERILDE